MPPMRDEDVRSIIHLVSEKCGAPEFANTPFVWSNRMTSTKGLARWNLKYPSVNLITLSTKLFDADTEENNENTIAHEIIHCIAPFKHQRRVKSHGYEWVSLMRLCGYKPTRCHSVKVEKRTNNKTKYLAKCGCSDGVLISSIIKTRMVSGKTYRCRRCKQILTGLIKVIRENNNEVYSF